MLVNKAAQVRGSRFVYKWADGTPEGIRACIIRKLFLSLKNRTNERGTRSEGGDSELFVSAQVGHALDTDINRYK